MAFVQTFLLCNSMILKDITFLLFLAIKKKENCNEFASFSNTFNTFKLPSNYGVKTAFCGKNGIKERIWFKPQRNHLNEILALSLLLGKRRQKCNPKMGTTNFLLLLMFRNLFKILRLQFVAFYFRFLKSVTYKLRSTKGEVQEGKATWSTWSIKCSFVICYFCLKEGVVIPTGRNYVDTYSVEAIMPNLFCRMSEHDLRSVQAKNTEAMHGMVPAVIFLWQVTRSLSRFPYTWVKLPVSAFLTVHSVRHVQ